MALPLVVGVDGSDPSLTAVDWAVDEAVRRGLPLRLVYGSLWERYEGSLPVGPAAHPPEAVTVDALLASAAERVRRRAPDVELTTEAVPAEAVDVLLDEGRNASVLVTGSRGRGQVAGLLLGSVGLAVAARAHCPVVVVRGDKAGLAGTHERILLGVGEPATAGDAVRFAFREAEARGCTLDAVRGWRSPAHEPADRPMLAGDPAHRHEEEARALLDAALHEAEAEHPSVRVRPATVEGPARAVLLNRAAAADLVVIGARRRTGRFGLQLGRVAHTLLHHAPCPVAVVPQQS
ncbi:universal stress protein [Streptomyces sp. MS06]|uniref:universal stress protein n=1 Tax=Streptomyces sp. MS06 TaxID=3385974 RepID=UPI0039A0EBD5